MEYVVRMTRKILLLLTFCFLIGTLFFPRQIFTTLLEWKVSSYFRKNFGAKLVLKEIVYQDGKILFKEGELRDKNQSHIIFSKATLNPIFNLKKREIGGRLFIEGLKVIHRKKLNRVHNVQHTSSFLFKYFSLNLTTALQGGEIFLYDDVSKNTSCQHLYFDAEHQILGDQAFGTLALNWDSESSPLITYFHSKKESPFLLSTHFQSHDFPVIAQLTGYFFSEALPPSVLGWEVTQGKIDGHLETMLIDGAPKTLQGKVVLYDLQAENLDLELLAEVDHSQCDLDIDFSKISAINGDFSLAGGRLSLENKGEFWGGIWDLSNLHTNICVRGGDVNHSALKGTFLGMEGELALDWQANEKLMEMHFQGSSVDMQTLLPGPMQEKFQKAFPDDYFELNASVVRSGGGLELEGRLTIDDGEHYQISFGSLFGQTNDLKAAVVPNHLFSFSRSMDEFLDHLKQQFCLSQKLFGWFQAEKISIQKFITPFLLHHHPMELSGRANFEGTFDERYLVVLYEGEDFCLDSSHFRFETNQIKKEGADVCNYGGGVHYIDLLTRDHVGYLPIKDAKYLQKNFGFCLENADAVVHFENQVIRIQNIVAQSEGMAFQGDVELTIRSSDDIDLKFSADHIGGTAKGARRFLSHFSQTLFWDLPFEGEVFGGENSLFFHYTFTPKAELISGYVHADICLNCTNPLFQLDAFHAKVAYNCKQNCFELKEGAGGLFISKLSSPFHLSLPKLSIKEFPDFLFDFTFFLTNDQDEIFCEGYSFRLEEVKEIVLKVTAPQSKGQLSAFQKGNSVYLADCHFGDWGASGSFSWDHGSFFVDQLHCSLGEKLTLSLSGVYDGKNFEGDIQTLAWDLGSPFEKSLSLWKPKGEIFGEGTLKLKETGEIEAKLHASFHDLAFGGVFFGSGENLICRYVSNYGFSVEGLAVEITTEHGPEKYKLGCFHYDLPNQKIRFDGFDFSLPPEKLSKITEIAGSLFPGKFQPSDFDWIEAIKQNEPFEGRISLELYPDNVWIYLSLKDGVYHFSNRQIPLQNFQLIYDPLHLNIWTQCQYQDKNYWLHLISDSMSLSHGRLILSEHPLLPTRENPLESVTAIWERQRDKGWCIRQILGRISGIDLDLIHAQKMDFSSKITLKGSIGVDLEKSAQLFHGEKAGWIDQFSFKGKYCAEGEFIFDKNSLSKLVFKGNLSGKECQIAGVGIASLTSNLTLQEDVLQLENLEMEDLAGRLSVNRAIVRKQSPHTWLASCDRLTVAEMRISRLQSPWTQKSTRGKSFLRTLFIPIFELTDFSGNLMDPETFLGSGKLEFSNLPKRTFLSNLLLLPTEITARIGLDLSLLIPVRGIIDYEIKEGKIHLNEFKEMFSDGKRSRFYLAENTAAFVDFKGRLNMKIKMKQYNLLMKLAEFFTISVKGTLLKPAYTLSNHSDEDL